MSTPWIRPLAPLLVVIASLAACRSGAGESITEIGQLGGSVTLHRGAANNFGELLVETDDARRNAAKILRLASLAKAQWRITLRDTAVTAELAGQLAAIPTIVLLNFDHCELSPPALAKLSARRDVLNVAISRARLSKEMFTELGKFPQPYHLELCHVTFQPEDLGPLAGAKQLGSIHFSHCPLTDEALTALGKLPELNAVMIVGGQTTAAGRGTFQDALGAPHAQVTYFAGAGLGAHIDGDGPPRVLADLGDGASANGPDKEALQPGDLILEIAGQPTPKSGDVLGALARLSIGQVAKVVVERDGKRLTLSIKLQPIDVGCGQGVLRIKAPD